MKYILLLLTFLSFKLNAQTVSFTGLIEVCENETFVLRNNSSNISGSITEYAWDFENDGNYDLISSIDSIEYAYTTSYITSKGGARNYDIRLRIITSLGDTLYSSPKNITVNYLPVLFTSSNPSFDSVVCRYDNVFFFNNFYVAQGTINNTYWYFNDEDETYTQNYFNRSFDTAAVYNVKTIAYTDKGCKKTVFKNLYVKEIPNGQITYSGPTTFYNDKSVDLTVSGEFDTIAWNNGSTTPTITVNTSGTYVATLTNNEGCKVTVSSDEIIVMEEQPLDAMNLLTLNDDGKNDVFKIYEIDAYGTIELTIFNRNGVLVYEDKDYKNTWNGKDASGNKLAEGAYFYMIKASELPEVKKGTINLVY